MGQRCDIYFFNYSYTYDTYDVTGRGPDGPCDQITAGYQVLIVELSYTLQVFITVGCACLRQAIRS